MATRYESLESRGYFSANLVADMGGVYPHDSVTLANGETFFVANDGRHGAQLWVSDGTVAGTHLTAIIQHGGIGQPQLTAFGNRVALLGSVGLWTSDGTAAGTIKIADLPGTDTIVANSLESTNGHVTFVTSTGAHSTGGGIWSSDGTVGNLVEIETNDADRQWQFDWEAPSVTSDRVVYFNNVINAGNFQIVGTDGTVAGTAVIAYGGVDPVGQATAGGNLFFWQSDNQDGLTPGLYVTDGTTAGTQLLSTYVSPLAGTYGETSVNPAEPAWYHGTSAFAAGRYFYAGVETQDAQLNATNDVWESDGTVGGTHVAFTLPMHFGSVASVGNKALIFGFTVHSGSNGYLADYTLYTFDPLAAQLSPIYSFNTEGLVKQVTEVGNEVYFFLWRNGTGNSGANYSGGDDLDLWATDGTTAGTHFIQQYGYWPQLTPVGDNVMIGSQIIEPAAPTTLQSETQNAVSLVNGVLRVFGTSGDDDIRIYQLDADPSRLVIDLDGVKHSFAMSQISRLNVYGEEGDDSIAIVESHGKLGIRTHVDAGAGDDTIFTGGGRDTIVGGFGNDSINSGNNGDDVEGDGGNDTIVGGNGDDTLGGDDGADVIFGNKGRNFLSGGDDHSRDLIYGSVSGSDVLFGQAAIDVFFDGSGKSDPDDTILN